ncbi:hypothetical protein DY000_02014121 [Brassica cretica]|uniref:Uncharacterized protein n=1 Tax=Brassica cretica TaxID=69181 RepID=A0ABQ7CSS8_BRACR|nr:hypothetical protein DY000_02014121 [Brassica cretica]
MVTKPGTASEALYNPDVSNVDLEPYSHWSLNFRRNSRLQRMKKRTTTKKKKEAKAMDVTSRTSYRLGCIKSVASTETSTSKKKKNKNKSKKKPQQTDPPTIPIVKFFPSGDFR